MILCLWTMLLAKSAGIQTIVLIPSACGVEELGSVRSLPKSLEMLQTIWCSFLMFSPFIRVKPTLPVLNEKKNPSAPSPFWGLGSEEKDYWRFLGRIWTQFKRSLLLERQKRGCGKASKVGIDFLSKTLEMVCMVQVGGHICKVWNQWALQKWTGLRASS